MSLLGSLIGSSRRTVNMFVNTGQDSRSSTMSHLGEPERQPLGVLANLQVTSHGWAFGIPQR